MKCNLDRTKLNVDNILKNYYPNEIDINLLCDWNIEKAQAVFKYLMELITNIKEK